MHSQSFNCFAFSTALLISLAQSLANDSKIKGKTEWIEKVVKNLWNIKMENGSLKNEILILS